MVGPNSPSSGLKSLLPALEPTEVPLSGLSPSFPSLRAQGPQFPAYQGQASRWGGRLKWGGAGDEDTVARQQPGKEFKPP